MVSVRCFGVGVSVVFRFMFVHCTFGSVWVAEWPPFGKKLPTRLAICSHCIFTLQEMCCGFLLSREMWYRKSVLPGTGAG